MEDLLEWATVAVVALGAAATFTNIAFLERRIGESITPILCGLFLGACFQVAIAVIAGHSWF